MQDSKFKRWMESGWRAFRLSFLIGVGVAIALDLLTLISGPAGLLHILLWPASFALMGATHGADLSVGILFLCLAMLLNGVLYGLIGLALWFIAKTAVNLDRRGPP